MKLLERLALCIMAALTLGALTIATGRNLSVRRHFQEQTAASKPVILPVHASYVLAECADYQGSTNSPYTLVEFADYQCPPCRAANREVQDILAKHPGKLRFAFRNFPLVNLHLHAMPAAVAAEAAREQGSFWPMHDALMQGDLDAAAIRSDVAQLRLDRARFSHSCRTTAQSAVMRDARLADRLNLSATPTFLLCCPQGLVVKLGQTTQIEQYLPAS